RNLQSLAGWVNDTDGSISPLRSAEDLQGSTMKRVKRVEDLNIRINPCSGYCGAGATIRTRSSSRWAVARPHAVDRGAARVFLARARPQPRLSGEVRGRTGTTRGRKARLPRRLGGVGRAGHIRGDAAGAVPFRLGGLRQTSVRRSRTRAPLSR